MNKRKRKEGGEGKEEVGLLGRVGSRLVWIPRMESLDEVGGMIEFAGKKPLRLLVSPLVT